MDGISAYSGASLDYARQRRDMFLTKADSDGDGSLSLEEFSAAKPADAPVDGPDSSEIFASLDSDSDGYLTQEELEAGKENMPPPPPKGGSQPLMGGDMLSDLLKVLEEASSSTTETSDDTSLASLLNAIDQENGNTQEQDVMALIRQELDNYRNSTAQYANAAGAYSNAGGVSAQLNTLLAV